MSFLQRVLDLFRTAKPHATLDGLLERPPVPVDHPLRADLDQRYLEMRAAMASGNGDAIAAILAPRFVSIDIAGAESNAEAMIDSVRKLKIDRSKRSAITTLVSIEAFRSVATVMQRYSMSTTEQSLTIPRRLETLSRDVWLLDGGTWRLAKTETLEVDLMTGDGARRYIKANHDATSTRLPLDVTAHFPRSYTLADFTARYEEPVAEFLLQLGIGEVDGVGVELDEAGAAITSVDLTFFLVDDNAALERVRAFIKGLGAPQGTELRFRRDQNEIVLDVS